ncbi:MAG: DUF4125 family protein [Desulfuromonadales bacterium]|nr:DUF4125 family protein [Desulfuromonadales bacterium]
MDHKENLTARIVALEWQMFQKTRNIGGPAPCQQDPLAFEVARSSQVMAWSVPVMESYLHDVENAEQPGRNLVMEKYARMMKTTAPDEYTRIEPLLPRLDPAVVSLIDRIVAIVLTWGMELSKNYPHLMSRGRPLHGSGGPSSATSIETYLKGELATYSPETLELYLVDSLRQQAEGINGAETVLDYTIKRHGYGSLSEAEQQLSAQS